MNVNRVEVDCGVVQKLARRRCFMTGEYVIRLREKIKLV